MDIVNAQMRDPAAKAKQLRRAGTVPCALSGAEPGKSMSIQIDRNTARQLKRTKRSGSKVDLCVGAQTYHTLIKDIECGSPTGEVLHIGFSVLDAGRKTNSVADIVIVNRDKAQGVLEQMQMRIPHAAEPEYLIDTVEVDVAEIPVGTTLTIGDIAAFRSDKIELQADPGSIVLRVSEIKRADEAYRGPENADGEQ